MGKKYTISYAGITTGWEEQADTAEEVRYIIQDLRRAYTPEVQVFDHLLGDFVFFKDGLCGTPQIDLLFTDRDRDLRTKTRRSLITGA